MVKRRLREVIRMVGGAWTGTPEELDRWVSGVSTDTRTLTPGALFVPLVGTRFDGHQFVREALGRGASAFLWQRDRGVPPGSAIVVEDTLAALQRLARAYRRELGARVIGVTGSNGKTTTKDLIAAVLAQRYRVHKTQGNLNNHIGLPLTLLSAPADTEVVVCEMGMSGRGEIACLSRIAEPQLAVITTIGEAHLAQLGSREAIAEAKLEIVEGLDADGTLFLDGDEPLLDLAAERFAGTISRCGFGPRCQWRAQDVAFRGLDGMTFRVGNEPYAVPIPGRHNVKNALYAVAVGRTLGLAPEEIRRGLAGATITGMRTERVRGIGGATVLNDAYNASPTSVRASLELLAALPFARRVAVLGDMLELGPEEEALHRDVGRAIDPARIHWLVTVGKRARWIAEGAAEAGFPAARIRCTETPDEAADAVMPLTGADTVILVKASRGMALEAIVRRLTAE